MARHESIDEPIAEGRRLCLRCGHDVAAAARRCPSCQGRPFLDRAEPSRDIDALSVVALVLSVGWFFWVGSIAGLVLGYRRLSVIDGEADDRWGRPLASGAIAVGWAGVSFLVLGLLYLALRLSFHYVIN